MRKVVVEYNVCKLEELTGINYRNAIDTVSRLIIEEWNEFDSVALLDSMKGAAERFGLKVTKWSIGLFDRNHVTLNGGLFDEERATYVAKWINDNLEEGAEGSCPFTGVHFDSYFFDYFKENGVDEDNVKSDIVKAITYMLETCVDNAEKYAIDDESALEYAEANKLEFLEDGRLYNGESER